jgi:cytidylate kinase
VRLIAPLELRIQRVADEQHIPLEAARAQIEASDQHRKQYLKRFYRVDWEDPSLYDLVINTGRISCEAACELICLAAKGIDSHTGVD